MTLRVRNFKIITLTIARPGENNFITPVCFDFSSQRNDIISKGKRQNLVD